MVEFLILVIDLEMWSMIEIRYLIQCFVFNVLSVVSFERVVGIIMLFVDVIVNGVACVAFRVEKRR